MKKVEMVAMILAGGKGTRLESLTKKVAKPAVFFGGKYRIIDFVLSNCAYSGIDVVGVLTQYESIGLNSYIGNGKKWGIDGNHALTQILNPRQTEEGANWYLGTADAIYRNLDFLDLVNPQYVLVLSGDHIYKMNYEKMLDYHKEHNADLTIASIEVTKKEASRFGILEVDDENKILAFHEKPKNPTSTLASMGVYIFNYKTLRDSLLKDAKNEDSQHDFGKNIIPYLLEKNKRIYSYLFDGYWKDVGTVESLWQANMDLLDEKGLDGLDLYEPNYKIFSEDTHSLPQYVGESAVIKNSIINQGASIEGEVIHSVIFNEVTIKKGAKVINSVIMPGSIIEENVTLNNCIVSDGLTVKESNESDKVTLIGR